MPGKKAVRVVMSMQVDGRPVTVWVEKWEDQASIFVPTAHEQYGCPEDVRALEFIKDLGDLLDLLKVPHEKMFRNRLQSGFEKVVDRIRMEVRFLPHEPGKN